MPRKRVHGNVLGRPGRRRPSVQDTTNINVLPNDMGIPRGARDFLLQINGIIVFKVSRQSLNWRLEGHHLAEQALTCHCMRLWYVIDRTF